MAIGAAYAGKRSMAVMKHVGLNVAADSLLRFTDRAAAWLVLVVADDPGMHSSQNEQDSRRYASFAARLLSGALRQPGGPRTWWSLALQLSTMIPCDAADDYVYHIPTHWLNRMERVSPVGQDDYVINPQKYDGSCQRQAACPPRKNAWRV